MSVSLIIGSQWGDEGKGKITDVDSKKNIPNGSKGNEIILSKFDTRINVSKRVNNVKQDKINVSRKSQKKG